MLLRPQNNIQAVPRPFTFPHPPIGGVFYVRPLEKGNNIGPGVYLTPFADAKPPLR